MEENQNIEYKQTWKDEYLKGVSGFANNTGGRFYIGIDDTGEVLGVQKQHKLMEDIPNKIVNHLGIVAEVNLLKKVNKNYIEIIVPAASVPVSFKGRFYLRSGSTIQELKGNILHRFMLNRMGQSWDNLPCESAVLSDIDEKAVTYFFDKAAISNRIAKGTGKENLQTKLENLNLITDGNKFKNAALLLFGKNPSRFFPGVSFKIGRFIEGDDDLHFQDVLEGNILEMADKVIEVLKSKYLISPIHYEGLQRIEKLELPEDALREAIFNAIIHKDYTGVPIQLSVYNEKLILWNEGRLPDGFTVQTLLEKHPSRPYNKTIADIFFKAGFIEAWGRGISKIIKGFNDAGLPKPVFETKMGGVMVIIFRELQNNTSANERVNERVNERIKNLSNIETEVFFLILEDPNKTQATLSEKLSLSEQYIRKIVKKLKDKRLIKRVGSSKKGYWKVSE